MKQVGLSEVLIKLTEHLEIKNLLYFKFYLQSLLSCVVRTLAVSPALNTTKQVYSP